MGLNQGINHKHLISTKQDLFLCSCGARFPIASRSDEDIQNASRLAYAHVDAGNAARVVTALNTLNCKHLCNQMGTCLYPSDPHCARTAPENKPSVAEIKYSAPEQVNHPNHYGGDTVYETIKVLAAWQLGFLLGNAVKYISRAGKKDPAKILEDLKKARFYLDYAIKRIEQAEPLF